ncbi:MAG: hypothetical protein IT548_13075 [Alphaproteobacteria bacterium]|nr:hypothetical protein [Alphaproteobacteria bacterium]
MTMDDIGRLTEADEGINHQIADTFASVRESDRGWTEKIWGSIARKDGGLQIDFGLGRYPNRNVIDGFGGVSRNYEQWTVRASRELASDFDSMSIGPVRYEVVEPLKKVRFALDRNKSQPISFDVLFEGELPPFFEKRNRLRTFTRVSQDVVRYHQAGKVSGWLEVDGERHEIGDDWFAFRDHSWGMRGDGIGQIASDLQPATSRGSQMRIMWGPWLLKRPDGSKYEIMHFVNASEHYQYFSAHVNEADGSQHAIRHMAPNMKFDSNTRVFKGMEVELTMETGEKRHVEVSAIGDSGFYLRTAEYGSWKGFRHGAWRGAYHEDGEYIPSMLDILTQTGQFRDKPVMVREGDAVGFGIQETILIGVYPELGLTAESDFPSNL